MGDDIGIVDWLRGRQESLDRIECDCCPEFLAQAFTDQPRARFGEAADRIETLEAEITTLRGDLAWYRDAQYDPALSDDIHEDKGQRARTALERK